MSITITWSEAQSIYIATTGCSYQFKGYFSNKMQRQYPRTIAQPHQARIAKYPTIHIVLTVKRSSADIQDIGVLQIQDTVGACRRSLKHSYY